MKKIKERKRQDNKIHSTALVIFATGKQFQTIRIHITVGPNGIWFAITTYSAPPEVFLKTGTYSRIYSLSLYLSLSVVFRSLFKIHSLLSFSLLYNRYCSTQYAHTSVYLFHFVYFCFGLFKINKNRIKKSRCYKTIKEIGRNKKKLLLTTRKEP